MSGGEPDRHFRNRRRTRRSRPDRPHPLFCGFEKAAAELAEG